MQDMVSGPDPSPVTPPAPADTPGLAAWEYAGLMLTYGCNARCTFCYVHSGPERGGLMPIDLALAAWQSLDRLAARSGHTMRIHLAGGEPFQDWPRLVGIIRAARDAGLTPLEKVETNAGWATSLGRTRSRLELLKQLGLDHLLVSCDIFHQEYIPMTRVQRCVELARRVLGRGHVRVRWWDFFQRPVEVRGLPPAARDAAYAAALQHHPERLTGRAAARLSHLLPLHPATQFRGQNCVGEVLQGRHVHVDPCGYVFPGVCSGIILDRIVPGRTAEDAWDRLATDWSQRPVIGAVTQGGSYELMRRATALGYRELTAGYASKCHLCTDVRQFLFERGHWPEEVGPAECYAAPARTQPITLGVAAPLPPSGLPQCGSATDARAASAPAGTQIAEGLH